MHTISVFKEFNNNWAVILVQLINFAAGIGKRKKSTERKRCGKYDDKTIVMGNFLEIIQAAMKDGEKKKAEK